MGFWTDWLDPNIDGQAKGRRYSVPVDTDPRTTIDKLAGVARPSEVFCAGCDRHASRCKCDPKLGRPRRWYE